MTAREIEVHAGHWANEGSGANGLIKEAVENRKVAKRVYEILRNSKVPATYCEDNITTNQRDNVNHLVAHHNKDTDGLIVSIHFNASGGTTSKPIGTEVLYSSELGLAMKLSQAISDATNGGLLNRGAKKRTDLGVLVRTKEPAVLLEICFVNSTVDVAIYRRDFEKICQAIASELAKAIGKTIGKVEVEVAYSSPALQAETEASLDSKAHREFIVKSAVANGAHASWLDKLEAKTITEDDLKGLAIKAVIALNKGAL